MKIFEKPKKKEIEKERKVEEIYEETRKKIEFRIKKIKDEIEREVFEEHLKEAMETLRKLGGKEDAISGEGRNNMWKLLKNKYPKSSIAVPVAKKDRQGNKITNHESLKHLYLQTYINRLRNRTIKSSFEEIKERKLELFKMRLKISEGKKSEPWKMKNLEEAIKHLKNDKARDPDGLINELFKNEVAGNSLRLSLLKLFNRIKEENEIPNFVKMADISTIYKGNGEKCDLKNDRGIFIVSIFRSILMRMIYMDKYSCLDSSISDAQVGGRKGKSVRNHIWVLNAVICDILSKKKKTPVDLQIFDYKECFDSLWLEDCMNDMYNGGIQDDKFSLLYKMNTLVNVAVRTPVGKNNRGTIKHAIIQGDVFGPMFCGKHVDDIGKECIENNKYIYKYKGEVNIPPLIMIDDLITVSECGPKTTMINSYINTKTAIKKLQFGTKKCKKIHVGKMREEHKCQPLYVDNWKEKDEPNSDFKEIRVGDIFDGEERMEETEQQKYLGDIVSQDGRNIKNFKMRVIKGIGIAKNILNMLEGIYFGKYHYEAAIILRNSLLVSSVIFNCEAWYNITSAEMTLLESVDIMMLRGILKAPRSTPKEMLYLELGVMPLQYIVRKRRLIFLYYILQQEKESILSKVFHAQLVNPTKNDWITTIKKDLKQIKVNMQFNEIKEMKKDDFINLIKRKVEANALQDLENIKSKHSKVKMIKHPTLKLQNYLKPNKLNIKREHSQLIFKLRCQVTDIKENMKNFYDMHACGACGLENENQKHVLQCNIIQKHNIEDIQTNNVEYEKIQNENAENRLKIAKHFQINMKILKKIQNG